MKVGDLVNDTRHSPEYTPRPGLILSIIKRVASIHPTDLCWVKYPGILPVWAPMEALEVISESR